MVRNVRLEEARKNDSLEASVPIPEGGLSVGEAPLSVKGYFVRSAGRAVIIDVKDQQVGNVGTVLLPTSQVHIKSLGGTAVEVYMKAWLYREKFR